MSRGGSRLEGINASYMKRIAHFRWATLINNMEGKAWLILAANHMKRLGNLCFKDCCPLPLTVLSEVVPTCLFPWINVVLSNLCIPGRS